MYKRLRNLFYFGCIAIFVAAFIRSRWQADRVAASSIPIQEATTVDRGDITLTVSATGPIHAQQELPLVFLSAGKISSINVSEGDHVLKGQTLAILDNSAALTDLKNAQFELNLQQVAFNALTAKPRDVDVKAAQAAVDAAQAQLAAAQVGYDPLQVKLAELQVELAKNQAWQTQLQRDMAVASAKAGPPPIIQEIEKSIALLPPAQQKQAQQALAMLSSVLGGPTVSPKDAEAAVRKNDYEIAIAQAQLAATKDAHGDPTGIASARVAILNSQNALDNLEKGADTQSIAIADAQLKAAQAALDLVNFNLSHAALTAPFDGVVAKINLALGQEPPTDVPAIQMLDISSFYVDVPVDEADISQVNVGQAVTLTFDSLPGEPVAGKVGQIATTSLNAAGVVTYPVRVEIESAGHALRAGMSTTATITVNEIKNVIRLRNRFIRLDRKTGQATVTVHHADGTVQDVNLTLGLRNETYSEVKSGLIAGDEVVLLPRSTGLGG